jgi:nicotinate-nucleotide pyrophosphorylase (carboxylating)
MHITPDISKLIDLSIQEDYSMGDATTEALIPNNIAGKATLVADTDGILAGLDVALEVFIRMSQEIEITKLVDDGSSLIKDQKIAVIHGELSSILTAERTSLNFLRKLSGVATETDKYVKAVAHTKALIVDTRKTTPGFRLLEKYAVRTGGGHNHRHNLGDGILIKENHTRTLKAEGLTLTDIIQKARRNAPHTIKIEVEVEDLLQFEEVLRAKAELILLDNMSLSDMEKAVNMCDGGAILEASGGINLQSVGRVANTGVDLISVGALTHSSPDLDLSLDID